LFAAAKRGQRFIGRERGKENESNVMVKRLSTGENGAHYEHHKKKRRLFAKRLTSIKSAGQKKKGKKKEDPIRRELDGSEKSITKVRKRGVPKAWHLGVIEEKDGPSLARGKVQKEGETKSPGVRPSQNTTKETKKKKMLTRKKKCPNPLEGKDINLHTKKGGGK